MRKAKPKSRRTVYQRRRNPQVYRLQAALRFYQGWDEARLIEKAGNLTGRLLAINKTLGEEHGREILSPSVREAMLTLYAQLTPDTVVVKYRRGHAEGEGRGQAEPGEGRVPDAQGDEDGIRLDVPGDGGDGGDAAPSGPDVKDLRAEGGAAPEGMAGGEGEAWGPQSSS